MNHIQSLDHYRAQLFFSCTVNGKDRINQLDPSILGPVYAAQPVYLVSQSSLDFRGEQTLLDLFSVGFILH